MPIIVLEDVKLPNNVISSGVRGSNLRNNSRIQTQGGFESVNINWSKTLRQYEIATVPLRIEQWQAIEGLHEITEGGAFGFLMEDPKDCTITGGKVIARVGGGYQLQKRYMTEGSTRFKDRNITRTNPATFVLMQNGTPLTSTSYVLNAATGTLTITGNPDPATLTWAGRFYVPVHFLEDNLDWGLVIPGSVDQRFFDGPAVTLVEVRE